MTTLYDVYLRTPFMEVYQGLNVKFVKPSSHLRTQAKNIERSTVKYHELPPNTPTVQTRYIGEHLRSMNMVDSLERSYHCKPSKFDLPKFKSCVKSDGRPICVVRPATIRKEWNAASRNPDPHYIAQVIEWLRETHYIVSVADIDGDAEYALDPLPYADLTLHEGELSTKELLGLIREADIIIGGVGFIVPACIAYGTRLFCILGGNGAHNHPSKLTHPSMDLSNVHFAKPDKFCMCNSAQHQCDKWITDLRGQFDGFIQRTM